LSTGVDPRAPVLVGAGQVVHRHSSVGQLREPLSLIEEAMRAAADDSGVGERILRRADSVGCVPTASWIYRDLSALLAERVGAAPHETVQTAAFGGDGPGRLLGDTAQAIADGRVEIALLGGGEAVATRRHAERHGEPLPWTVQDEAVQPTRTIGSERVPSSEAETAVGLLAPVDVYALLESAVRARRRVDPQTHLEHIARLWSRLSEVAARNPYAWTPRRFAWDAIAEPSPSNRPVSGQYRKLLTANIQVDLATGLILCCAGAAERLGVPRERWVFVHATAHAEEEWFFSERRELAGSLAIRATGRAALEHAGLGVDEVAYVDLYSCFPSAVEIAAEELGLAVDDPGRSLTVTGGLTFAGGPGNNYTSHALATLTGLLREEPDASGLATAVGWFLTKHALAVLSGRPPGRPFRDIAAGPLVERPAPRQARTDLGREGTIEAYTVPYARDGTPQAGLISVLSEGGDRVLLRTDDADAIEALVGGDPLGRVVTVRDGRIMLEPELAAPGAGARHDGERDRN
jgi:acetyl-CoA C-acetyltransferase